MNRKVFMQIIDTHVHYGSINTFSMSLEDVCSLMKKKEVDVAVISSIENAELYDEHFENSSIEANSKLLREIRSFSNLYMQYWIRPKFEEMNEDIALFITSNRDKILGLKIHPFTSSMCINDNKIKPYLEFADKNRLTVSVHTATGYACECRYLAEICGYYPGADFIAVHMDLMTDHKEAVQFINDIPNLYGDVSWITYNDYKKLGINEEKIVFGSDIPINMDTAYEFYDDYFFHREKEAKLLYDNAKRIFLNKRKA